MIEAHNLSKHFGTTTAVNDISFTVKPGEVVGLLGPNGAGKTTTMKMLVTLLAASAGRVSVCGYDTVEHPLEVRRRIGYLPETCPLYPEMDVISFLRFIAAARHLVARNRTGAIERVFSECGLQEVRRKPIERLSRGYRQRVGIAQALLHRPDVLILDEPTAGLDPNQKRDILDLIRALGSEKTVIHSTHILSEIETTASRVLIIDHGTIVARGTTRDLLSRNRTAVTWLTAAGTDLHASLQSAPFIESVEFIEECADGYNRFALKGNGTDDIAAEVYRLSVDKGWTVSELKTVPPSLDDLFLKLTRGAS